MATTMVTTNCYRIEPGNFIQRYWQYDVITPDPHKKDRAVLIDRLQTLEQAHLFHSRAVFDGQKMLFSPIQLDANGGALSFNVSKYSNPRNTDGKGVYNVKLAPVGYVSFSDLHPLINGQPTTTKSLAVMQLLNLLVRQAAIQSHPYHKGRSFFANPLDRTVGGGGGGRNYVELLGALELWAGAFQSVRPILNGVIVNVDVSTACMYRQGKLIDVVLAFLNARNPRDLDGLNERDKRWNLLKTFLKKVKVKVRGINKIRTIDNLQPCAGEYKFKLDSNGGERTLTVAQYYKSMRNINIMFPRLPGIRTGPDAVIPFELCTVEPGQFYKKRLSPENTNTMLNFTKKRPHERLAAITTVKGGLQYENSDYIHEAQLNIANDLMNVPARLLPTPTVRYRSGAETPDKGAWNLVRKKLFQPGVIKAWAVLCFDPATYDRDVDVFVDGLIQRFSGLGITVEKGPLKTLRDTGHEAMRLLEKALSTIRQQFGVNPSLLLIILPSAAAAIRKAVKVWGDTLEGIPTQIVRADKMKGAKDQYFNNLALKINAKIGGFASTLDSNVMKWFKAQPTMILGADVNHPGPGVNRPSIAALVNTMNETATRYFASVSVQEPRTEIIQDLGKMLYVALKQFHAANNNVLPMRIIVYRDGVSEGEFQTVAEKEIEAMRITLKQVWIEAHLQGKAPPPKITFIIVGKRHHMRFFPTVNNDKDNSGNLKAGFVVDSVVTSPLKGMPDFYLQSHSGLLGTSRPSHYTMLKDEHEMPLAFWQELSYELCYLYARCTRSVSIPAPVYYADICCARADFHFQRYNFEDDSSTEGGFDLDKWKEAFKAPHMEQAKNMYFM